MILKTISVVLPENMIREVDAMLLKEDFASRSDFFRHLVRMFQLKVEASRLKEESCGRPDDEFADVDLEHGIPPEIIRKLEAKVELLN